MLVSVLLKEKQFFISCGPATQPALWLAHVACLRYDTTLGQHIGPPVALRRTDGDAIHDWTRPLHTCVTDGEQLVVELRGEREGQAQQGDEYALSRPMEGDEHDEGEEQSEDEEEGWEEDGAAAKGREESSDSDEDAK